MGIHLGVATGLMKAARRARQIGATALQIFSDNPTAWRRRPEPPARAPDFVAYLAAHDIAPVAIHSSYLINLAGSAEPFASQSRAGLLYEMQRAPAYGARYVNTHIGSHRGGGREAGIRRIVDNVNAVLAESPEHVTLVLENSSGGGDNIGTRIEDLAAILEDIDPSLVSRLAFCLDTAHLWGAGHDIATAAGAIQQLDRFEALIAHRGLLVLGCGLGGGVGELGGGGRGQRGEQIVGGAERTEDAAGHGDARQGVVTG